MRTGFKPRVLEALKDDRGGTALDFALLSIPLIALILFTLQLSIVSFFDQALQTATEQAARQLMVGSAQDANLTQTAFKNVVCAKASLFTCANLMVDVESGADFTQISTSPLSPTYDSNGNVTNTWSYSPGSAGNVVIMRVMYDWPIVGGPFAYGLSNQANGTFLMVATAVFKNEPYQ